MKRSRSQFTNVLFALSLVALCVAVPAANAGTTTYDFSDGLQGWTQLYPALPTEDLLWQDWTWEGTGPGCLLAGGDWGEGTNTYFGRSPEFTLDAGKIIAFKLIGSQTMIDTPAAPDAIPVAAIEGGFVGVALRDVTTNTYLMWTSRTGTDFTWQANGFSAAALAPLVASAPAALYTLDYIDYDMTPGNGWVGLDSVNINAPPTPTIWDGPTVTFTKADYADWTLPEN